MHSHRVWTQAPPTSSTTWFHPKNRRMSSSKPIVDPSSLTGIKDQASAFCRSYGNAMELSLAPNPDIPKAAAVIADHYGPNYRVFMQGGGTGLTTDSPSSHTYTRTVSGHLSNMDRIGLGWAIKLVKYEVQPYSEGSALCWLTWEVLPREGWKGEGWQWTNVYGYRAFLNEQGGVKNEGKWEFVLSDQEVKGFFQCPGFMELSLEQRQRELQQ